MRSDEDPRDLKASQRRDPVGRSIAVLLEIAAHGARGRAESVDLTLSELARRTNIPISSVSRIVANLQRVGMIAGSEEAGDEIAPGPDFLRLVWLGSQREDPLVRIARPLLRDLTESFGETSLLGLYSAQKLRMMYVAMERGPHPVQYTLETHDWLPLHAGASGLAILAFLTDDEITEIIDSELERFTPLTLTDPGELRKRLDEVRREGVALSEGHRLEGVVAIAAPFFGWNSRVLGDIVVALPAQRSSTDRARSLASSVKHAASALTSLLIRNREIGASHAMVHG